MELFSYSYMQRALLVGFFLALLIPAMGVVVVNKRISVIGDALSHVSLSGVMLGLILGINPVVGALVACVLAALGIEGIRKRYPSYGELSTAIVLSTGVGLASILSGFVKGATNFESFLFGSIIAITNFEFYLTIGTSIVAMAVLFYFYRDLMYISFDEISARISGVPVERVNRIFIILTGITVAVSSRTVGVLIISSLMVIPVACAMQFGKGYGSTMILAMIFGVIFMELGLILSFLWGLKPGGTIVLLGVITLIILFFLRRK